MARRLRPLRRPVHPDELARGRHLPHRRRPRRRRRRRRSASPRSTAGPTTPTSTRPAACCGRSSRSTARRSRGPTCWSSPATSRWRTWASRPSASASAARTSGSRRRSSGARRTPGSATSATAASASSPSPLGAVQMGLIYVNPEGPNGNPDPLASARDIRETFAPDGDERRGDRRADRRRPHLRQDPRRRRRRPRRPRAGGRARSRSRASAGRARTAPARARTPSPAASRSPGPTTPTQWGNGFFEILFGYEWELTKSPAGANQWVAKDAEAIIPGPTPDSPKRQPTMLTTDLALRFDPAYEKISRRFLENPDEFARRLRQGLVQAAAPRHGPGRPLPRPVGRRAAALAGPGAGRRPRARRRRRRRRAQGAGPRLRPDRRRSWSRRRGRRPRRSAAPTSAAAPTAPASASSRSAAGRSTTRQLATVLRDARGHPGRSSTPRGGAQVSLADLIVLGGSAAVEKAAQDAGVDVDGAVHARVAPTPPRSRPTSSRSPCSSRGPTASATTCGPARSCQPETLLVDRAYMLDLTAPEMTVLVGGLRALGANVGGSQHGVLTDRPGVLTNDFFVNLLDPGHGVEGRRSRTRTSTRSATSRPAT